MSGTAALAAARKRRANPQPNVNSNSYTNSNNSNASNTVSTSNSIVGSSEYKEEFPKATNPAMLLMQHNMLIQRLQKELLELKTETKDLREKSKGPETGIDYKTEYLGLLEEMKEMKKVLLKVQSFSMETNLEVMKLKRLSESKTSETDRIDLTSITITNDIDAFAV
jgi:hypothetical protein